MDLLMEAGTVSLDDMAARFGVSRMTIHRDLDELEESGLLRKVRGGASVESSAQFESDFRYRQTLAREEKQRLAAAAAAKVEPGQTVMIDDGSTALAVARLLGELRPLTIITNNLAVITELAAAGGISLISLGGRYNKKFNGFFGLVAEEALAGLRADVAFLSTSAIQGAAAFHQEQEVVQTKRLMMAGAGRKYLLADHAKFGKSALHFLAPLNAFDAVLSGRAPDADTARPLADAGVTLDIIDEG